MAFPALFIFSHCSRAATLDKPLASSAYPFACAHALSIWFCFGAHAKLNRHKKLPTLIFLAITTQATNELRHYICHECMRHLLLHTTGYVRRRAIRLIHVELFISCHALSPVSGDDCLLYLRSSLLGFRATFTIGCIYHASPGRLASTFWFRESLRSRTAQALSLRR